MMLVMMLVNANNNRSLIYFDEKEHLIISLIYSNPNAQITLECCILWMFLYNLSFLVSS